MSKKETVFISVDIEATGSSPTTSSCVMIGAVVFKDFDVDEKTQLSDWVIEKKRWTIKPLENRPPEEKCWNDFWLKHKDLWDYIMKNGIDPHFVMKDFRDWYTQTSDKYNCQFVARPASYDWQWINCMYDEFGPEDKPILPHSIICISTIMKTFDILGISWEKVVKPLIFHPTLQLTHYSDDDALLQAYMYLRLKYWLKKNIKV